MINYSKCLNLNSILSQKENPHSCWQTDKLRVGTKTANITILCCEKLFAPSWFPQFLHICHALLLTWANVKCEFKTIILFIEDNAYVKSIWPMWNSNCPFKMQQLVVAPLIVPTATKHFWELESSLKHLRGGILAHSSGRGENPINKSGRGKYCQQQVGIYYKYTGGSKYFAWYHA